LIKCLIVDEIIFMLYVSQSNTDILNICCSVIISLS